MTENICDLNCLHCPLPDCVNDKCQSTEDVDAYLFEKKARRKEQLKKAMRKYYQKNKEAFKEKSRAYRLANPERYKQYQKNRTERRRNDPEYAQKVREYGKKYAEEYRKKTVRAVSQRPGVQTANTRLPQAMERKEEGEK